ncbi:hypothetical protein QZH41_003774 [Actinostola sp. cb2023]|nr:hypothetical protein QZH41_003774 [Actinostola sp. cb2023]
MADYTVRNTVTVVPLDGSNYGTWKIQCRMALIKENLWSIVSGTEVAPAETEVEKFTKFVVRRNRALATIVLSVNTSLLYLLGDPEDPVVVWKKLSEQFQKKTWANKLSLRRRLNKLRLQEGDSVKGHIKSITEIFNELAVIGAPMEEEDKVVTLLASLPDKFDMLVTALEANSEVPNMEVVTERLFHEENKLKERETVEKPYEKVMLGTKSKNRPKCHHCGKPGHLKRNCWSLKKEKEQQNKPESKPVKHKANVVAADSDSESLGLVTQALAASVCANDVWIIDSGATCHMTNDRSSLRDILELTEPVHVQLGDGKVLNATARGTVTLYTVLRGGNEKRCNLKDVLFVPKLSYSLLSVPKATGAGLKVSFDKSECKIVRADGATIAVGKKVGSLFHLKYRREVELSNAATAELSMSKEMLWHQRYGHLGTQNLKKLANESLVTGFDFDPKKGLDFCEACVQGKLHRCSFPTSGAKRATEPLGLAHSDLCGKITPKSAGGAEYFMTLTDDKTRYVWVYALKKKDEAFKKFQDWKALVEKSSGYTLKILRSDNGGEYVSTDFDIFLKSEGVVHQTTVPKTPQQNGVAERLNRTLVESRMHIFPKDERKKLDPKARKCVFLGYGTDTKAYRLFDVERQRVIYSRDVKFDEGAFGILQKDKPDGTVIKLVDVELSNNDDVELSNNDDVDEGPSVLRQSSRERRPPDRLGEWVTVVSDGIVEPTTVSEALNGPDADQWHVAMQQEMDSLHKHDVWNLTELPDGRKAVGSPSDEKIAEVKQNISERFEVKDMGELKYFLGVQVIQEDGKVWIGQPTYTENILKKFGMENCKPVSTPVDPNFKLTKAGADNVPHNQSDYQSVVGSLLYLSSVSRPDIAFAVSNVARYSSNPTNEHWAAVKRILRYLKGTVNYGLLFTSDVDSDFFVTALEMGENRFDGDEMKPRSDELYVFRLVLQLLFVNIPLLVIRLVVWVNYKRDASIFIAKNGIIIVTSVMEIIRVAAGGE